MTSFKALYSAISGPSTQGQRDKLGGLPFGPVNTGKLGSVKALGHKLGRFVVVFNSGETIGSISKFEKEVTRAGGEMGVDWIEKRFSTNAYICIFITMNPNYSGWSNLP
uniref:AAA_6 domain-containing protein n=1 Tax=Angiostrongylus cantonensis TaxID=6313 RepID=A0A0K0DRS5_ANGCA